MRLDFSQLKALLGYVEKTSSLCLLEAEEEGERVGEAGWLGGGEIRQ